MANPITMSNPPKGAFSVTTSDTTNFSKPTSAILVTAAGNVACVFENGDVVVVPVNANTMYPMRLTRINATLTTATGIIGFTDL